jgi:type II secretory pathway component PulF
MLTYSYTAKDIATGRKVKSEIDAESEQGAAKILQSRGLTPLEIVDTSTQHSPLDIKFSGRRRNLGYA